MLHLFQVNTQKAAVTQLLTVVLCEDLLLKVRVTGRLVQDWVGPFPFVWSKLVLEMGMVFVSSN